MMHRLIACGAAAILTTTCLLADDWPMWRHDSGRTGVTQAKLADSLTLLWSRQLPELEPAYQNGRLQFDAGYEPVAAGGKLLIASSLTDSVTAYDAVSGDEVWVYRTGGPIRFAPAVSGDAVCFGSDDGCLYCVELGSGKLRWKHRAVPSRRKLLGNRRLISVWPIRGGPVVADGHVYFAAGVWPFEGVFVAALEIETGDLIWRNERLGYLFGQQPHNTQAIGGLAPQGYLVVQGDRLIVPCSTAYPALLNRTTGELVEFELPGPGRFPGGWFAAIDQVSARDLRRGKITFDDLINRQQHEDKLHKGYGVTGISRMIRAQQRTLNFDDGVDGVEGKVHAMIVADQRLFVATREGMIYAFGAGDRGSDGESSENSKPTFGLNPSRKDWAVSKAVSVRGKMLVEQAASPYGYAIVMGLDDGELVKSLIDQSKYHVIAIDEDSERIAGLRQELVQAGVYGTRAAVMAGDFSNVQLPPYIATLITSETPWRVESFWPRVIQTLRPFGGFAALGPTEGVSKSVRENLLDSTPGEFQLSQWDGQTVVRRVGALPGSTDYVADWSPSPDELVKLPLGVLWFDDALAHFKRSPQPQFLQGTMISRPKDWHAPRIKGEYSTDYPLLPTVLSDMYTGRIFADDEQQDVRQEFSASDPEKREPSQYRPPRQKDAWKPKQPVVGQRINPLTGETEPRAFPKTYGCDGGVDYGSFYTLRAGTPAFYDKTLESGTVFLSGPRSGCTNSIIPAGGLLNVPYFYEGCTCSYPLPVAMSLYALPERHEQWAAWGESEPKPGTVQRVGLNFAAPGDRMTRDGTLWLDYPSVGGPSPKVSIETTPESPTFRYRHSLWVRGDQPWVTASTVEGLRQLTLSGLKPGRYEVNLAFVEPDPLQVGERVQTVSLNGQAVLQDLDVLARAGEPLKGITLRVPDVKVDGALTLTLSPARGESVISGIELIRHP